MVAKLNFDKMTNAQKRVAVAKDALKQLRYVKVLTGNTYLGVDDVDYDILDDNAQKHLGKLRKNCEVCALGSLFLGHVRLFNEVTVDNFVNCYREMIVGKLDEYFDRDQLDDIENAFEDSWEISGKTYNHPKTRLRAILVNIVKNKGTFKPQN